MKQFLALLLILNLACSRPQKSENSLFVFAAASLTNVLPEAVDSIRQEFPELEFKFNFAGSSILAKQIDQGAPADIFISADPLWTNTLLQSGALDSAETLPFVKNRLVIVVPKNSSTRVEEVADAASLKIKYVAMGDPEHVPAGRYARQALQHSGVWQDLKGRIITAPNVRAALAFVETGETDLGLVYQTDALVSERVKTAFVIPERFQPDILYVALLTNDQNKNARRFFRALLSQEAKAVFEKHGFQTF